MLTRKSMKSLVVLLPTLNEAEGLQWVDERIPYRALYNQGYETKCMVVDGHSNDGSLEIASSLNYDGFEQIGHGKGNAIRQAFHRAIQTKPDVIVMLDADGTYDPRDMLRMLPHLEKNDVIVGDRLRGDLEPGSMTPFNYFGNHVLTWIASVLYNRRCEDLCSGFWMFSAKALQEIELNSLEFELEAEMYASCIYNSLRLQYVPIRYAARIGEAKLGSTADGWHILKKLLIRRFFPKPFEDQSPYSN